MVSVTAKWIFRHSLQSLPPPQQKSIATWELTDERIFGFAPYTEKVWHRPWTSSSLNSFYELVTHRLTPTRPLIRRVSNLFNLFSELRADQPTELSPCMDELIWTATHVYAEAWTNSKLKSELTPSSLSYHLFPVTFPEDLQRICIRRVKEHFKKILIIKTVSVFVTG